MSEALPRYMALAFVVAEVLLILYYLFGNLTKGKFISASVFIVFLAAFFWMQGRITEMTFPGIGTIKTAVDTATQLVEDIKNIKADAEKQKQEVTIAVSQLKKGISEAQSQLEQLQKLVRPRRIDHDKFVATLQGQPKTHVEVLFLRDDPDSFLLAQLIWQSFVDAKWDVSPPAPVQPNDLNPTAPTVMSAGGQPSGVTVVAHSVSFEEIEWWNNRMSGKPWIKTPWTVVSDALWESLGGINGAGGGSFSPPEGTLRVVIAPRL